MIYICIQATYVHIIVYRDLHSNQINMLEINFGLICFIYRIYMYWNVLYITYIIIIYCVCTYDTLSTFVCI